jgi:hypothetical protein
MRVQAGRGEGGQVTGGKMTDTTRRGSAVSRGHIQEGDR